MDEERLICSNVLRNGEYTGRMPSPPRIPVPPPTYLRNRAQLIDEHVVAASAEFPIFKVYDWEESAAPQETFSWKYESRRQAQKILPFLYLGPMSVGRDQAFLDNELITMIVAVRHPRTMGAELKNPSGALRMAVELGIVTETIEVANNQALISAFPHITSMIINHLSRPTSPMNHRASLGKVLVVCESGNERSAAVVVAFIMQVLQLGIVESLQMVNEKRFCVNVDDGMRHLLLTYSDLLRAKRDVISARQSYRSGTSPPSRPLSGQAAHSYMVATLKRSLNNGEDEEMEDDDTLRFQGRVFAPFHDRNPH